jgi:xanthine dehydrogenase YagS FAD-binding subunit
MIPGFELYQPTDLESALALLDRFGERAWPMAGGYDSLDWFKDRVKEPRAVIDLEGLEELRGIEENAGAIEIGALTTLTDVERDDKLRRDFPLLADAARQVASPQIRNAATLGGNLCQDARCWYYRQGLTCYRAGGNVCYADTPQGINREHCLFGASRCVAVTPSDTAPALVALDASMMIRSARRERVVRAEDFFMRPSVDITRMTVLEPGELLTGVRIPDTWAGAGFYFEKVADRNTWDFALVSVAAAMRMDGERIQEVRVACGGVACTPRRLKEVEGFLTGRDRDDESAERAGALAVQGATPLNHNHFKVPLLDNLVKRAVRGA